MPPDRAPVAVAKETAIVVWDRDTRTERFIRTATFTGTDGPMAFLVPTPAPPRLTALNASNVGIAHEVFNDAIAPRIVTRHRTVYRWVNGLWPSRYKDEPETSPAGAASATVADKGDDVEVLSEAKVGGYDTAVLRADDPKALLGWLRRRGFGSDARLEDWLRPYTQKEWAITAFRFRPTGKRYTTAPVCLSFPTDRPFYPYREPTATNAPASRSLRVFLVAPERRAGRLQTGDWPTAAEYAGVVPEGEVWTLASTLGVPGLALRGRWLTSFLDKRPVRRCGRTVISTSTPARRRGRSNPRRCCNGRTTRWRSRRGWSRWASSGR